jgi:putative transposase
LPLRRLDLAADRIRGKQRWLQKLASVRADIHNYFNLERHFVDRQATVRSDRI